MSSAQTASDEIDAIFAADGPLAGVLKGYAPRAAQREMAVAVAAALERLDTLVVEAGTGVGKTLAYLVPALLSERRVVISTGTRNLQDQLFHRDLPAVTSALGQPVSVALLKGRGNYLCRYRLQQNAASGGGLRAALATVLEWSRVTDAGDISEVPSLGERHAVWPLVTSSADNCLGQECPDYSRCHVVKARRAAQAAQIVVVNHHLLLADFNLKEEGFGELLPGADACIVDEAHQLPETAANFFGVALSGRQITGLIGDIDRESHDAPCDGEALRAALAPVRDAAAALREALGSQERRVHYRELGEGVAARLAALRETLVALAEQLDPVADASAGLDAAQRRAGALAAAIETLADVDDEDSIRWAQITRRGFSLHSTPLEAAEHLRAAMTRQECAWVFTSATLAVGDSFAHFAERTGLDEPRTLALGSPFDFERNALLCLPRELPAPNEAGHTDAVVALSRRLIEAGGGGAFLLFTSHRALRHAAQALEDIDHPLLVQGEAPRDELLRAFRSAGNAVLLGAASFWEGVDVRGDALRLVVIDKLPFASPGDPVMQARLDALRRRGVNPFMQYQLPQAVLALKQGVGRLIRDPADTGVCVLCDTRVTSKHYGRVFRNSLPPMRVTASLEEARDFLRGERAA